MTLRWTMDKVGPICRTVEDCAIVFDTLRGPDGKDETVVDAPHVFDEHAGLAGLRIGYIEREFQQVAEGASDDEKKQWPTYQRLLDDALDLFRKAGVTLHPIALPDLPAPSIYALLIAESGAAFDDLVRAGGHNQLAGQGPRDRANQLRASRFVPAVDYIRAQRVRTLLAQQMNALMATCDVFLAPSDSASVTITNLTGHPALTLNAGFVDLMPRGLMITGRLYDEATVLRVAAAYQRATHWHEMRPKLA
jgi:Asp-tRNA(Asn)/Glu-tRNA(Gln) amidotransferase A subunit family amidase